MIIPKQMINHLQTSKIAEFVDLSFLDDFSEGGDHQSILNAAKYHDAIAGENSRVILIESLPTNAHIWAKLEGTKVKEIYQVFNPLTGQYTTCNSVEEAKKVREQVMKDYLKSQKGLFSVAQEIETSNGDTLWNPIDLDKM